MEILLDFTPEEPLFAAIFMEVKEDFLKTLEVCDEFMPKDCKCSIQMRVFQDIMRLFAPLM